MDKVTQQNAAGAEESASAAEELSAQAQTVKGMVNELVAMVGGTGRQDPGRLAVSAATKGGGRHAAALAAPGVPTTGPTERRAAQPRSEATDKPVSVAGDGAVRDF